MFSRGFGASGTDAATQAGPRSVVEPHVPNFAHAPHGAPSAHVARHAHTSAPRRPDTGDDAAATEPATPATTTATTAAERGPAHRVPASTRPVGHGPQWLRRYQAVVLATDVIAALIAGWLALTARFGLDLHVHGDIADLSFACALPVTWIVVLVLNGAYESRVLGHGNDEFLRLVRSFVHVVAVTVLVSYLTRAGISRVAVAIALPATLGLAAGARYYARRRLHAARSRGYAQSAVLAVGGAAAVVHVAHQIIADRFAGLTVVGACVPTGPTTSPADEEALHELRALGIPVLGDVDSVRDIARRCGARTVAVCSGEISAHQLRWVSWQLEDTDIDLVVSPGLIEVAGRRLHIQPVSGLPLLYVDKPEFTGVRRLVKTGFDRLVASTVLVLTAPMLAVIAVLVRTTSSGPVFYKQTRIGLNGKAFRMIKFRSMHDGSDRRVAELSAQNESEGPLFKMRDDPRVTSVGKLLRRYSLDELPQLFNVLGGSMSLVGPRPPLPNEVASYEENVKRRLLVKPGLTGLWQVSGRSDLSWEESVRLDLRYVENWSLTLDLLVLAKTAGAVLRAEGAY